MMMKNKHPGPQSSASRFVNEMARQVGADDQYVWAVYNSGDPLQDNPCAIDLVLFASKHSALEFVRSVLQRHWQLDAQMLSKLSDDAVEHLMWDGDRECYLHLYELKVHADDYCTINMPF